MGRGPGRGWSLSPAGGGPAVSYLPDLDRWIADLLGIPPLTFIDVRGETEDPFLMFTFSDEDESEELSFLPSGDVTFEVDDRGETATLTWVSESNDGNYGRRRQPNRRSREGQAELTIECGSIFRHTYRRRLAATYSPRTPSAVGLRPLLRAKRSAPRSADPTVAC